MPGQVSSPIETGGYAMSASPPVQISDSARPAPNPPGASIPASMTRAPPGSVRTPTRSAAALAAIASAIDRKSTRLNSSHDQISYAVFCLKKKKKHQIGIGRPLYGLRRYCPWLQSQLYIS